MANDNKRISRFKLRNGQVKRIKPLNGITQTPLRRLNGYRISPSESDESYNSDYSTCVTPSDVILNESKHSVQHNLHQASLNALDCKAEVPSTSNANNVKTYEGERLEREQWGHEPWIRQKFYIVENGGRPSEIFRTDFLIRAKAATPRNAASSNPSGRRLLRVNDRWREEWNNGVQVPLINPSNNKTQGLNSFQVLNAIPDFQPVEFHLPKKRIAFNQKTYTQNQPENFVLRPRSSIYYYNMDVDDMEWLTSISKRSRRINSETQEIEPAIFLNVINYLEVATYKNIHAELLKPLVASNRKVSEEEDTECEICRMPESEPEDQIVFCDGCNISVHQSCYGIDSIPSGEWLCNACCDAGRGLIRHCLFCPIQKGAMKPTKHQTGWAHVACALWIPEVRFGDVENREPITHINEIPAERWQHKCSICDTRQGACIKCTEPKCEEAFHVSCALRADCILLITHDVREPNGVRMISLCRKHSQNSHYKDRKKRSSKQITRLSELTKNYIKFVTIEEASQKLNVPIQIVSLIFEYWRNKRDQNDCKPLIDEPDDIKLGHTIGSTRLNASNTPQTSSKKRHQVPSIFDTIPPAKLKKDYETCRILRLNLEKARNLSYMVLRREKLKKSVLNLMWDNIAYPSGLLFDSHMSSNKRRVEKLLSICTKSFIEMKDGSSELEDGKRNDEIDRVMESINFEQKGMEEDGSDQPEQLASLSIIRNRRARTRPRDL